jgi:steroid delta-isomerase-like uncharacterized protein
VNEREELMRAYLGAWNDGDAERIASFFAGNAIYEDHGAAATALGRHGIRDHAARVHTGFPDLRFDLVRAAHGGDFTAGEWRSVMTHLGDFEGLAASGRVVRSSGVDVATLDQSGLIVRLDSYYDGAEVMRELGLLPARGSRLERALVRTASKFRRRRRV